MRNPVRTAMKQTESRTMMTMSTMGILCLSSLQFSPFTHRSPVLVRVCPLNCTLYPSAWISSHSDSSMASSSERGPAMSKPAITKPAQVQSVCLVWWCAVFYLDLFISIAWYILWEFVSGVILSHITSHVQFVNRYSLCLCLFCGVFCFILMICVLLYSWCIISLL